MKVNSITFWVIKFTHGKMEFLAERKRHRDGFDTPATGIPKGHVREDDLPKVTFQNEKEAKKYLQSIRRAFGNGEMIQRTVISR